MVLVSLIQNIAPLLVAFFSYILYKKGLSNLDIAVLITSFIGVAIMITGQVEEEETKDSVPVASLILPAILLITIPFNYCSIQLFLRNMRNLSEYSITAWLNIGMLTIFLALTIITTPSELGTFDFLSPFIWEDWVIAVLFGITSVFSQTARAKAVHYEEPNKLTVLNYFQSIIQLFMDILIVNVAFTG